MSERFDDLTRILASRMPRREAIRLLIGSVAGSPLARVTAGGVLAFLGTPGRANAYGAMPCAPRHCVTNPAQVCDDRGFACPLIKSCCPPGYSVCRQQGALTCRCCLTGDVCCTADLVRNFRCCPAGQTCCGPEPQICCLGPNQKQPGSLGEMCCRPVNAAGTAVCCDKDTHCCCGPDPNTGLRSCDPKPGFKIESYRTEPPSRIEVGVTDYSGRGLTKISVVTAVNARVDIPALPPGTTYAEVTATRIDPKVPARIVLEACTRCGTGECCDSGDPVLTQLRIPDGTDLVQDSFYDIPARERYLTVDNGSPGLRRLQVFVNDQHVTTLRLKPRQLRVLDLGSAMDQEMNTVALAGRGKPGSSALVIVSDIAGTPGAARESKELRRIEWEPGTGPTDVSLHWGR